MKAIVAITRNGESFAITTTLDAESLGRAGLQVYRWMRDPEIPLSEADGRWMLGQLRRLVREQEADTARL